MFIFTTDGTLTDQQRLQAVQDLLRHVSRLTDPQQLVQDFRRSMSGLLPFDRTISLSRRGLEPPRYRITRSGIWPDEVNPWQQTGRLPLLERGLLGELIYGGVPRLENDFHPPADDPAAEHLAGMRSLLAVPHFDEGEPLNMVVHLCRGPGAFDVRQLPEFALMSGLFGRTMRSLVAAQELRIMRDQLKTQYDTLRELGDTVIAQAVELKRYAGRLEERVEQRTQQLRQAQIDTISMLATACEAKDVDTGEHVRRVRSLTRAVALRLGVNESDAEEMGLASMLHDVGKIHVPDSIVKKPGDLTDAERAVMQAHALAGERILGETPHFALARRIARWHHENFDGSGYPDGLSGDRIPLEARIVHVVDTFDALTHLRVYKDPWPRAEALAWLRDEAGRLFDPKVVEALLAVERSTTVKPVM